MRTAGGFELCDFHHTCIMVLRAPACSIYGRMPYCITNCCSENIYVESLPAYCLSTIASMINKLNNLETFIPRIGHFHQRVQNSTPLTKPVIVAVICSIEFEYLFLLAAGRKQVIASAKLWVVIRAQHIMLLFILWVSSALA